MLNREKYITLSLELHLFWARIMKEHSLFLEASFTPKDKKLAKEAEHYKECFEKLLLDTVKLSNKRISESVLGSGELITAYTLNAEKKTQHYTGIDICTKITLMEKDLHCKTSEENCDKLAKNIKDINCKAMKLLDGLIALKAKTLDCVLHCELFTTSYPALIEHTIHEAKLYHSCIKALEENTALPMENIKNTELFWNDIMKEHALFMRGLLDPSENELIKTANQFACKFSELIQKANDATSTTIADVTNDTLMNTIMLKDFKTSGAEGILDCKIRSTILPLLADHVLREANHYIRILSDYKC